MASAPNFSISSTAGANTLTITTYFITCTESAEHSTSFITSTVTLTTILVPLQLFLHLVVLVLQLLLLQLTQCLLTHLRSQLHAQPDDSIDFSNVGVIAVIAALVIVGFVIITIVVVGFNCCSLPQKKEKQTIR